MSKTFRARAAALASPALRVKYNPLHGDGRAPEVS